MKMSTKQAIESGEGEGGSKEIQADTEMQKHAACCSPGDAVTQPVGETDACFDVNEEIINIKGLNIAEVLYRDQLEESNSMVDCKVICQDGYIPVHRCILTAASPMFRQELIDKDPSDMTVIMIPDVKVASMRQVLYILYTGKLIYSKKDERVIYDILKMLTINPYELQFRPAKSDDGGKGRLKYFVFAPDDQNGVSATMCMEWEAEPTSVSPGLHAPYIEEAIILENGVVENPGPKVKTISEIDKAETEKLAGIRMELPRIITRKPVTIKCRYCDTVSDSEEGLADHITRFCALHLKGKLSHSSKQCLICRRHFPSCSFYTLLDHVEFCIETQTALPSTVPQVDESITEYEIGNCNDDELSPPQYEMGNTHYLANMKSPQENKRAKCYSGEGQREKVAVSTSVSPPQGCESPARKIIKHTELENGLTSEKNAGSANPDEPCTSTETIFSLPEVMTTITDDSEKGKRVKQGKETGGKRVKQGKESTHTDKTDKPVSTWSKGKLKKKILHCSYCNGHYTSIGEVTKCIQSHGFRRCWICLELVPRAFFWEHFKSGHEPRKNKRVKCSFCKKKFGYNVALNIHMINFHIPRLVDRQARMGGNPVKYHKLKSLNSFPEKGGHSSSPQSSHKVLLPLEQKKNLNKRNEPEVILISDSESEYGSLPTLSPYELSIDTVQSPPPSTATTGKNPGTYTSNKSSESPQNVSQRVYIGVEKVDDVVNNSSQSSHNVLPALEQKKNLNNRNEPKVIIISDSETDNDSLPTPSPPHELSIDTVQSPPPSTASTDQNAETYTSNKSSESPQNVSQRVYYGVKIVNGVVYNVYGVYDGSHGAQTGPPKYFVGFMKADDPTTPA